MFNLLISYYLLGFEIGFNLFGAFLYLILSNNKYEIQTIFSNLKYFFLAIVILYLLSPIFLTVC